MSLELWNIKEHDADETKLLSKHLKRDSALREIDVHIARLKTLTPFQTTAYTVSECGTLHTWTIVDDDLQPIDLGITLSLIPEAQSQQHPDSGSSSVSCGSLSTVDRPWYDPKTRD